MQTKQFLAASPPGACEPGPSLLSFAPVFLLALLAPMLEHTKSPGVQVLAPRFAEFSFWTPHSLTAQGPTALGTA